MRPFRSLANGTWVGRRLRAIRSGALSLLYGRSGLARTVNGILLRVLPRYRWYFQESFDAPVAAYLRERVRPGMTCVSVGANIGLYPLQFAHWSGPSGVIHAFEPNPETATVLRAHVRLNGLDGRVRVSGMAVGARSGTATFLAAGVDGMSRLGVANPLLPQAKPITVPVVSLDEFFATEPAPPDVLVADVEGYEEAVLRGASGLYRSSRPPITVIEMHPQAWPDAGSDAARFAQLLDELRLRVIPLSGQRDPLAEYGHVALEPGQ
jgi:FkbM family methyltransferase